MSRIDEEIESLKTSLEIAEDIHPDYAPPELKDLQTTALAHHAQFERSIEVRIIIEVKKLLPPAKSGMEHVQGARVLNSIRPLLDRISYPQKLSIWEGYGDAPASLVRALKKANMYRNEFAHPDGMELRNTYNLSTHEGKVETRDLLRALVKAHQELNSYFSANPH